MRETLNDNPSLKSEFPKFIKVKIDNLSTPSELIELKHQYEIYLLRSITAIK